MKFLKALFVLALVVTFAVPAFAETQNVKVSGSVDIYHFHRDNFDLVDGNDAGTSAVGSGVPGASHSSDFNDRSEGDDWFMTITQIEVAADLTDNVSTVINLINQRDWNSGFEDEDEFTDGSGEFNIGLDLAYVQMREIFYSPLTLTIGRQDLLFGRGFIIGWNPQDYGPNLQADEFTQIQSFDAIRATLDFNPWTLDFVYSKIDENSHNAEDDKDLYIANVNYKFSDYNAVAEVYWVTENDRSTLSTTGASFGDTRNNDTHTVGGRVQFDPISQITLGAEIAYQFGHFRAATDDLERDRSAWALDVFGEYRWDMEWKPMIGIEYVHLSGENDLSSTADDYNAWNGAYRGPVYGWIQDYREFYWESGFGSDQIAGQNIQHISIYGSIQPMSDLKLTANWFYFWADETQHLSPTDPGSPELDDEIGWELDTAIIYSYTEDVTFSFMANWFVPGDTFSSPSDEDVDATASEYISRVTVTF